MMRSIINEGSGREKGLSMIVELSHTEYSKNGTAKEVFDERVYLPSSVDKSLGYYARMYRTSKGGMLALALSYYFGDGKDHLSCEYCGLAGDMGCLMPEVGEQSTLPLLDNGSVVVGHPPVDLVKHD